MIGSLVSHYRILEPLGAGGMGEVFLAEDVRLRRSVAIKFLRLDAPAEAEARARLLREARAASALNHPNIAVIYETDEIEADGGPRPFIALEYVRGQSIVDHVRKHGSDVDVVLDLVIQAADALAEAHRRGVIHRDIKPSNVLVTDEGRVKILDFGLAKFLPWGDETSSTWTRDVANRTATGRLMGTLDYMSPEQAMGQEVDARTDVFSLGALLHELLSNAPPFHREGAVATLDAILREPPAPLPARIPQPCRGPVERILARMLAKDRANRYPNLDDVAADLRALRNPGGERPAGGWEHDRQHFEALALPHLRALYRLALHLTGDAAEAEDAVQESYLRALQGFEGLRDADRIRPWLFQILSRSIIDRRRSRARQVETVEVDDLDRFSLYDLIADEDPFPYSDNLHEDFLGRFRDDEVRSALLALPEVYRIPLVLLYTEDLSYKELADVLGCPIGTIMSRLHRARKILERALWECAVRRGLVRTWKR